MVKKEKNEKSEISWTFPEFEQHDRSRKWWIWFVVVDVLILLFALLSANFLFALIIVMITGIVVFRHYHDPETITCAITDEGIEISDRLYIWSEIKNFWFVYEPPIKNLYLTFKSSLKANLTIPLHQESPLEVREFLSQYLEEDLEKEGEPTADALGRLLKL